MRICVFECKCMCHAFLQHQFDGVRNACPVTPMFQWTINGVKLESSLSSEAAHSESHRVILTTSNRDSPAEGVKRIAPGTQLGARSVAGQQQLVMIEGQ